MTMESKKKLVCKKPESVKSKAKQVKSDNPRMSPESSKRKRETCNVVTFDDVEAKFSVWERAERMLSSLEDEYPFFIKCLLPSNVAHSFWLHIPKAFCDSYLPSQNSTIMLVDEWGNEYKTTYLLERHGLSAGWRAFSIAHRLLKGDLLIFRLTEPNKFKVHIIRVNSRDVVEAAICLMNLNDHEKTSNPDLNLPMLLTTLTPSPAIGNCRSNFVDFISLF
nr:B3 domain-containing protein At5g42700-like isoform X1 [Ipomoea batatas]